MSEAGAGGEAAGTAPAERPKMQLLRWRKIDKGKVRGVASVLLPIGLEIHEILLLDGPGGVWAKLPSQPRLREGRQLRDDAGRALYTDLLAWRTRELREAFSQRLLALIAEQHPGEV